MEKKPKIVLNIITLSIAVTVIVCGFFVVKGFGYVPEESAWAQKSEAIKSEIAYEEEKIKGINEDSKNKDTPEYKEKVAREKLGMMKKGEKMYIDISGQE